MTDTLKVEKANEAFLHIDTSPSIRYELSEYFSFFADGYQWSPKFKNKIWDGKIRQFDTRSNRLPIGLYPYLEEFSKSREYTLELVHNNYYGTIGEDFELNLNFLKSMNTTSGGKKIKPYDYQASAIVEAIKKKKILLLSPTSSGKSFIIYHLVRYYLENYNKKILIVVPTTSLVNQLWGDFSDYSEYDANFNAEDDCHKIYSGKEKITDHQVVISTWQSIYKQGHSFFSQFGMVVGDEAHTFKAQSLVSIMSKCSEALYRIGTTGTIGEESKVNKMVLEGNFGIVHKVITTKELINRGTISELEIKMLVLKYPDEIRSLSPKLKYQDEIDFLVSNEKRNNFIKNLALKQEGNTLVLFNLVKKHGKPLYELIKLAAHERRKIFFVAGETDAEVRNEIRAIVEKEKDAIIIASLGVFSTGVNIKNLHNIIFSAPSKSQIKVLQSIGRGLRKSTDGRHCTLYDIVDDLSWKSHKNYTLKHAAHRVKIYTTENFSYKILNLGF